MFCYKDMTFCDFYNECSDGIDCNRALTPEVKISAKKWWGSNDYPICLFRPRPECFKVLTDTKNCDSMD